MELKDLIPLILLVVIDLFVDPAWVALNVSLNPTINFSAASWGFMYLHLFPLGISLTIEGIIFKALGQS